jgi:ABC-2 type transport system ATP-binding protein
VQAAADEVAILRSGRIVKQATVAGLREAAVRRVRVVVGESELPGLQATLDRVPGVAVVSVTADLPGTVGVVATLDTHVDAFVKAIAAHELIDLTIEEPDLEQSVLGYYGDDEEAQR